VCALLVLIGCAPNRPLPAQPVMRTSPPIQPVSAPALVPAADTLNPWSSLPIDEEPDSFRFAVVTDRTGGHRGDVFEQGAQKVQLLKPDFVMSVGDLIEGYTKDSAEISKEWDEFQQTVGRFGARFYYVPGNHDLSNPVMADQWRQRFGASYYHFVYRNVLFLCLNTEDGEPNHLSDEQLAYFQRTLAEYPLVRWTLLFMHRPLWAQKEGDRGRLEFQRVEELLQGRPYTVFAGHFHNYEKYLRNQQRYIILATTGGASALRGTLFGEFDHVAWVTMTKEGPRIANLLLSGIEDEDVRTEQSRDKVESYERNFHIGVENVYLNALRVAGATSKLSIQNGTPSAVAVQAAFGPSGALEPSPHAVQIMLQPGQKQVLPIAIKLDRPTPITDLHAVPFAWSAVFDTQGPPPMKFSGLMDFVVSPLHDFTRQRTPIVVDGRLSEWGKLAHSAVHSAQVLGAESWSGPLDLHYDFDLRYDDENLYIAVNVTDDHVASVKDRPPWEQDGLELMLDPRDDPERANDRRDYGETWRDYAYLAFSPAQTREQMAVWEAEKIPTGVTFACLPTVAGYAAEILIPNRVLDALRRQGKYDLLRFNLAVHDAEEPGGPSTVFWWQPDWHLDANVPGSGTFRRKP
jgi:hypothetical protein